MATIARTSAPPRPGYFTVRNRFMSLRFNGRVLLMTLATCVALFLLATWAMTLGSFHIGFFDVVSAAIGRGSSENEFIVQTLRLPRVICAILLGACFALAGAIFQSLVRNPLVSPDIIGIDAGATLVAVFVIVTGSDQTMLPFAAFAGALLTAAVIYVFAWKGGISPNRLVLVGIGIGAVASATTTYLMVKFPIERVAPAQLWATGSVYASDWQDVRILAAALALLVPAALALTWPLRALQLGDDPTRGLGIALERTRLGLIVVGCGLSAVAVAIAGPIGFVALMVPHIARMLAGPTSASVLLFTAILGGFYLLFADVIAQHFLPVALPVGVITAAVGAPYFLFLLYRSNLRI
jgi:iron complex transport system permease protein